MSFSSITRAFAARISAFCASSPMSRLCIASSSWHSTSSWNEERSSSPCRRVKEELASDSGTGEGVPAWRISRSSSGICGSATSGVAGLGGGMTLPGARAPRGTAGMGKSTWRQLCSSPSKLTSGTSSTVAAWCFASRLSVASLMSASAPPDEWCRWCEKRPEGPPFGGGTGWPSRW